MKLTPVASDGNRHDASGEEQPNRRVQQLYSCQDGNSFGLGFHEKSTVQKKQKIRRFDEIAVRGKSHSHRTSGHPTPVAARYSLGAPRGVRRLEPD
jgi:hypothetical protein